MATPSSIRTRSWPRPKDTGRALCTVGALMAGLFALAGCVPPGDGVPPPSDRVYFPVALAVTDDAEHLLVVGSDFDLQFNQGTIHSLNLGRIRARLPKVCSRDVDCSEGWRCDTAPSDDNAGRPTYFCVASDGKAAGDPCPDVGLKARPLMALAPGPCAPWVLEKPGAQKDGFITDVVQVPAFATDALLLKRPDDAVSGASERLFVPIRGDSSLHFLDVDSGEFDCGQLEPRGTCSSAYAVKSNPELVVSTNPRRALEVPPEPFGISATSDGRKLVMTHQTSFQVSAFTHDWVEGPAIVSLSRGLPGNPIGIVALPPRHDVTFKATPPGFLTTFRDRPELHLIRYMEGESVQDSGVAVSPTGGVALVDVARVPLTLNTTGVHSRGILVDDSARAQKIAECDPTDSGCVLEAEITPLDIYVANRSPNSLLLGRTSLPTDPGGTSDTPAFYGSIPLSEGPSGVFRGSVIDPEGNVVPRIFVACFDSAVLYVIDPKARAIESTIATGRGPQSLAFEVLSDESSRPRAIAYVAQFTDSYVSILSLDQRYPETYGATLATLGNPTPPRAAK